MIEGNRSRIRGVADELGAELLEQEFGSLEEAQAALDRIVDRRNRTPLTEFCGISPHQMDQVLYSPFDSPEVAVFSTEVDSRAAPVYRLFLMLADALRDRGLKATATGNLPREFCRRAADAHFEKVDPDLKRFFTSLRSETDFGDLHSLRIVAQGVGLIRKYRGRFFLTKRAIRGLERDEHGELFFRLFQTYATRFNWAYRDGYSELGIVQHSFLFSMFVLQKYGHEPRPEGFYAERFLRAFPRALEAIKEPPFGTAEEYVSSCYRIRCIERFAQFFGLIEYGRPSGRWPDESREVTKTALLNSLVTFPFLQDHR